MMTRKEEEPAYSGWKQRTRTCSAKGGLVSHPRLFRIHAPAPFRMPPVSRDARPTVLFRRGPGWMAGDRVGGSSGDPARNAEHRPPVSTALTHLTKGEPAEVWRGTS